MPGISTLVAAMLTIGTLLPGFARCAPRLKTLYSFTGGADGGSPAAALTSVDGLLYGTTPNLAGPHCAPQCGTVFSLNPATGVKTVLHAFSGRADGISPQAPLLRVGGLLYGTTSGGGPYGQGTLFAVDPASNTEEIIHGFTGGTDGAAPVAALIYLHGIFWGTTSAGGSGFCATAGCGTIFAVNRQSGVEKNIYSFQGGMDGADPESPLLVIGANLYGTTQHGGGAAGCTNGCGTIFQLNPASGAKTALHVFVGGADGASPRGAIVEKTGALYGVTVYGGQYFSGSLFRLDTTTGRTAIIASLAPGQGANPESGIILPGHATQNLVYGVASAGGVAGQGTLFSVNLMNAAVTALYGFGGGANGATPLGGLLAAGGAFYGTTSTGGASGAGSVFVFRP